MFHVQIRRISSGAETLGKKIETEQSQSMEIAVLKAQKQFAPHIRGP